MGNWGSTSGLPPNYLGMKKTVCVYTHINTPHPLWCTPILQSEDGRDTTLFYGHFSISLSMNSQLCCIPVARGWRAMRLHRLKLFPK